MIKTIVFLPTEGILDWEKLVVQDGEKKTIVILSGTFLDIHKIALEDTDTMFKLALWYVQQDNFQQEELSITSDDPIPFDYNTIDTSDYKCLIKY